MENETKGPALAIPAELASQTAVAPMWPPAEMVHIFDPNKPVPKALFKKISTIVGEMPLVALNGWNDHAKYAYAKEADIVDALRPLFMKHGIALAPTLVGESMKPLQYKSSQGDRMQMFAKVRMQYLLIDSESGEYIVLFFTGTGADTMPGDKAIYKASTGCHKFFIKRLLQIASGDDPENDGGKADAAKGGKPAAASKAQSTSSASDKTDSFTCNDCRGQIKGSKVGDKIVTPYEFAAKTKAKFGAQVCLGCAKIREERGKPIDTIESVPDDKGVRSIRGQIVRVVEQSVGKGKGKDAKTFMLVTLHGGITLTDWHKSHAEHVNVKSAGVVGAWLVKHENKQGVLYRNVEELTEYNGIFFKRDEAGKLVVDRIMDDNEEVDLDTSAAREPGEDEDENF